MVGFFGNVTHAAPLPSNLNNFGFALNGTGAPGIYNSSYVPDRNYGIYNWCNMPHARVQEYKTVPMEYELMYVEVIHRHHKRTPYAANMFPMGEDVLWECPHQGAIAYVQNKTERGEVTPVQWLGFVDAQNPFTTPYGYNGTTWSCQLPQITPAGLDDSYQHGSDLAKLYRDKLGFLPSTYDDKYVKYRVTNNVITSQVAGGLVQAMFPQGGTFQVYIQPDAFDSLEPAYSCPAASTLMSQIQGPGTPWETHLQDAVPVYKKLDAVSGIAMNDSTGFHKSFDHYYDNLSANQCHQKKLPCNLNDSSICVDQATADTVYRLGNWEYAYTWRSAPNSTLLAAGTYGAYVLELQGRMASKINGTLPLKCASESRVQKALRRLTVLERLPDQHNIAHDGSIAPLMGILQTAASYWPGMGTEILFELYKKSGQHYVRVLLGGQTMNTTSVLGELDLVPFAKFNAYLTGIVGSSPQDLYKYCNA